MKNLLLSSLPLFLAASSAIAQNSTYSKELRSSSGIELSVSYDRTSEVKWAGDQGVSSSFAENLMIRVPAASVGSRTADIESRLMVTESVQDLCDSNAKPSEPKTFSLKLAYAPSSDAYVGDFAKYAYLIFPSGVVIPAARMNLSRFRTYEKTRCRLTNARVELAFHVKDRSEWETDPVNGTHNFEL